ncbi:unnamed protein product [Parnassius mnemosyne]|uniref:Protein kinase domain-containing protein n=1 Tax=Parnassius mnemosyne TaxID=213953 RepID=A0AAV1K973_9NEOP
MGSIVLSLRGGCAAVVSVSRLCPQLHRELYALARGGGWGGAGCGARGRPVSLQAPRAASPAPCRRRPDTVVLHHSADRAMHKELHRFVKESERGSAARLDNSRSKLLRSESINEDSVFDCRMLETAALDTSRHNELEQLLADERERCEGEAGDAEEVGEGADAACEEQRWAGLVARGVVQFARCWMRFVMERCERGRGRRPRYSPLCCRWGGCVRAAASSSAGRVQFARCWMRFVMERCERGRGRRPRYSPLCCRWGGCVRAAASSSAGRVQFARCWMRFVMERCERGRGRRPRYSPLCCRWGGCVRAAASSSAGRVQFARCWMRFVMERCERGRGRRPRYSPLCCRWGGCVRAAASSSAGRVQFARCWMRFVMERCERGRGRRPRYSPLCCRWGGCVRAAASSSAGRVQFARCWMRFVMERCERGRGRRPRYSPLCCRWGGCVRAAASSSAGRVQFARCWMRFVMERCERGRGRRPRYSPLCCRWGGCVRAAASSSAGRVQFARCWMRFVMERCERGRGRRPRYSPLCCRWGGCVRAAASSSAGRVQFARCWMRFVMERCERGRGRRPRYSPLCCRWGGCVRAAASSSAGRVQFARCWMRFVMERCERGRGRRPRWASQGLEFLMLACDPYNTKHLSDEEFEELKQLMDACISHVIGSRPAPYTTLNATPNATLHAETPRRARRVLHSPLSNSSGAQSPVYKESAAPVTPPAECDAPSFQPEEVPGQNGCSAEGWNSETSDYSRRVAEAVQRLDEARDEKLRSKRAVGRVLQSAVASYEPKLRQVTFKWQRGLKIGAGTFGKVYTVVNTESGQLLAMKELSVCAGDRRALRRAANELRVLEGVLHPHLVRYYGCELHREEMLLFMELCVEGSLEALLGASGALDEPAVRRYTKQLLSAVQELHSRGIAHRDIKSGNIFLTNEGHCLKLGDFGCAVKIRSNSTVPGELQGFVGTQAYMAPEVFMKSSGHGRGADVWSLGCVVTEMASGKRPFSEYDSNYQIMFVVGMGGRPEIPGSLSEEGQEFCRRCLTHDPELRPRAQDLALHHFLMVKSDEDCKCEPAYLIT